MSLNGIQYLNDATGKATKAVVDLTLHAAEFNAFLQQIAAKEAAKAAANKGNSNSLFNNTATTANNTLSLKVDKIIQEAQKYIGTPYKTGGTSKSGMDCSGLTSVIFGVIGIALPRVSKDQSTVGTAVQRTQLKKGDLIFFATGTPNVINHVGVVSNVAANGVVSFIHASSSRGVMISDLSQDYWNKAYMTARRVLA